MKPQGLLKFVPVGRSSRYRLGIKRFMRQSGYKLIGIYPSINGEYWGFYRSDEQKKEG